MGIARRLGFSYLWIDAICIKQDDPPEMTKQMGFMDKIYACAELTIVSDASSVHAGIPGFQEGSRRPAQLSYRGDHIDLIALQTGPFIDPSLSPWSRRAWTFQEDVLSRALLVLAHDQAYYMCRSALYREDLVCESTTINVVPDGSGNDKEAERWQFRQVEADVDPDELFIHRLERFTKRNLTFPEDAIKAFAGVLVSLYPCHFGLPRHIFTATMNWTFRLRPRMAARNSNFPSWTWAGWTFGEAGVVGGAWFMPRHAVHYPRSSPDYDVRWYEVLDGGQQQLVNDDPFTLSSFDQHDAPLLPGYQVGQVYDSPTLPPMRPSSSILNLPHRGHFLRFWAIGAFLTVSREAEPREHPLWKLLPPAEPIDTYRISVPGCPGKVLGSVSLDRLWRAQHPDSLYFFVVSRNSEKNHPAFNTMLIAFKGEISQRIQVAVLSAGGCTSDDPSVRTKSMWLDAMPAWRLITLA
ncbi:hypothetical protein LTR28_003518 [Elasticomyces elasticus]|nr:hypothetical protein LTR28_003518 [Elasticomyces elasticus]